MGALCAFLLVACCYDYRWRRIPNWLLLLIVGVGVIRAFLELGSSGVIFFVLGAVAVMGVLYPFFKIGTLGAGDVKLLGVCSGYFSQNQFFDKILYFLFVSLLIAAIFSLIKFVTERNAGERFFYLGEYLRDVAQSGKWHLYIRNQKESRRLGICLAGPILCSVLLHMGGVY